MAELCGAKVSGFFSESPILSQWGFWASFFANYVAMVTRIGKKSNSTPFPAEPHVLMYILRRWRKLCGSYYVPKFAGRLLLLLLSVPAMQSNGKTLIVIRHT